MKGRVEQHDHDTLEAEERWRWLSLAAALFAAGGTGVAYAYSVYSGALKQLFNLGQSETELLGMVGNFVSLLSFVAGWAADRWGPAWCTGIGGTVFSMSYVAQWLFCHFSPGLGPSQVSKDMLRIF